MAASYSRVLPHSDDRETWLEVRDAATGRRLLTWRGGVSMSRVAWAPTGSRLSFMTEDKGEEEKPRSSLWLLDLETGEARPLLLRVSSLDGYAWSPAGDAIVYWTAVQPEPDKRGVKRAEGLLSRQPEHKAKRHLYRLDLDLDSGMLRRLTAGPFHVHVHRASSPGLAVGTLAKLAMEDRVWFRPGRPDVMQEPCEANPRVCG